MNKDSEVLDVVLCKCGNHDAHDSSTILPCQSAEHWTYALSQIRSSIYNSTSVALPNPGRHLIAYDKKVRNDPQEYGEDYGSYNPSMFDFNSEPMATRDLFSYRRERSEHLLIRIFHHFFYNQFQNLIRLSRGVFLSQKWQENEKEQTYPSPTSLDQAINSMNADDLQNGDNNIDTFSFNDIFGMMQQPPQVEEETTSTNFVPYSYTLGVRYTNPYNDCRDVVVRGNIPLWCQILFISSCLQQKEPIQPGTRRKGLLPFAMDISFSFTTCPIPAHGSSAQAVIEPYPLHTVLFERMCMELSEPEMIMDDRDMTGISWYDRQESILRGILLCDVPDALASAITEMGIAWAANQGIAV
ncbi:hypothetical protein K501DRAFT_287190 [Backusella circina FSU 941]|nr:hypothetical protein K501DRAFT_287190 [Backusella circina FSU 941]